MSGMHRALEAFLICLDPILLNPLTTNSNQRALGDELRWTGALRQSSPHADVFCRMWAHRAVQRDHADARGRYVFGLA